MLTEQEREQHLKRIQSQDARAAYNHLIKEAAAAGLILSSNTGVVSAVRLHDEQNRYLFSFIVNAGHLLFYIRKPALKAKKSLAQRALSRFTAASLNPGDEVTLRVENLAEAQSLSSWLMPFLPLPQRASN